MSRTYFWTTFLHLSLKTLSDMIRALFWCVYEISGSSKNSDFPQEKQWFWRICNTPIFALPSFLWTSHEASKTFQNETKIGVGRVWNQVSFWEGFQERFGYRFWLQNALLNQSQIGSKSMFFWDCSGIFRGFLKVAIQIDFISFLDWF